MSGARRLMLSGVGLTALLAVVAVASRAHKPGGGTGAGAAHPPRLLLEYAASVMVVLLPIGTILIVLALAQSRRQKVLAGERSWRRSMLMVLVMTPLFIGAFFVIRHFRPAGGATPQITVPTTPPANLPRGTARHPKVSLKPTAPLQFQWLPVLVLGSLVLAAFVTAGVAIHMRRRHGDVWAEEAALAQALDEVLADTLDDLRAERDPRRAVIRTYARMERTFAAYGVPRAESEVPQEYVARVLDRLGVSVFSVRRLTDLFSRAKFSPHEIDSGMKDEAIDALAGLRAELEHKEGDVAA
jgi:hypothetical protein